ncbi:CLUMA_CG014500, isoform A [Clunio marinus]|uniref:CLUMA_CG014500, isoform A n=1 Tax=Clunio marinus TaxID=568069 RepID=A0A1J1IMP8_9DIPT|nr:CLUMA_CG014500, isoform A [Clunio marinus]
MGVTGLWKLIEASGKPVALETLENKVLAIDISIWLHQVVKGYQDNKGGNLPNAHLLGLFNRICKLLYFRIKPVFVFDGGCPELKRQTIAKRAYQKTKIQTEAERLEQLLLESLAKEKIVKQALGDTESLSPTKLLKNKPATKTEERDEMFKLPPLKEENIEIKNKNEDEDEDLCPKRSYDVNINKIDVTSSHFKSLPADIRHEILSDIKDTRKQTSWGKLRELPVESNDFSTYQMSRLLRRRQVQVSLEEAEKEMGGKTWSLSELESLLTEDGVLVIDKKGQKIASNENTRFLLVRDIAKAMNEAKKEEKPSTSKDPQPSTSKQFIESNEILSEEDIDLQLAIQLSLADGDEVEEEPKEVKVDEKLNLNPEQRQKFSSTIQSHGLIRGFMMEYAEMNGDEVQDLMKATQVHKKCDDELNDSFRVKFPNTDDYVLYGTPKKINQSQDNEKEIKSKKSIHFVSDSESDDEFEEITKSKSDAPVTDNIVITVKPNVDNHDDDLFADVFKKSPINEEVPDVEVASISSDDDTLPYEISQKDFDEIESNKDVESGFVSEEVEKIQESNIEIVTEEEKKIDLTLTEDSEEIFKPQQSEQNLNGNLGEQELKTPEKSNREYSPTPSKVATPFFVNRKTPSTKKKNHQNVIEIDVDAVNVSKNLFQETEKVENVTLIFQKAADELKVKKTSDELEEMKNNLEDEQRNLIQERNKLDRMGTSITHTMSRDCKDLLKLFGIPYIDSPMEAEAQCAFLNMINLTDGTISDDSDIWLFGGQTVYKNFFVQKKIVMEFRYENIEQMFHLDRKKLIQLAMLVGSDYTVGLNGVGAVTALEILAAFPETAECDGETDQYQSLVSSLRKFREWFRSGKQSGPGGKTVLKSKLKNIELFDGFPNLNVAKAYLEPIVDTNTEGFTWGIPDTESLVEFSKAKLGWTRMKTEELLGPVMKRLNEKKQSTIKDYFKSQLTKKFFDENKLSKRVQKAVGKMSGVVDDVKEEKPKKNRKRKVTEVEKKETDKLVLISSDDELEPPTIKKSSPVPSTSEAGTSKIIPKAQKPKKVTRKRKQNEQNPVEDVEESSTMKKRPPKIPETKQIIPQREKDKEEQEKAKKKAIEIFKSTKKSSRK